MRQPRLTGANRRPHGGKMMANFISSFQKNEKTSHSNNHKILLHLNGKVAKIGAIERTFSYLEKNDKRTFSKNRISPVGDVEWLHNIAYFKNITGNYDANSKKIKISNATFVSVYNTEEGKLSFIE